MKQAQIQQMRRVLSAQITELHELKNNAKGQIGYWWKSLHNFSNW